MAARTGYMGNDPPTMGAMSAMPGSLHQTSGVTIKAFRRIPTSRRERFAYFSHASSRFAENLEVPKPYDGPP